jgi:hypothetical protein
MRYLKAALASTAIMALAAAEASGAASGDAAAPATETVKKSIVPAKYSGKYKDGGGDQLAEFIKQECTGKDGFEFTAFFELCRKNGIAEDKVTHYQGQIAEKRHGAEGRARMTLRNMLASIARKNGKLVGLNDTESAIELKKPAVSGAAAKAQEAAASGETDSSTAETETGA